MGLEIKITLNPHEDMTSHAALLRRVATVLERGDAIAAAVADVVETPAKPAPAKSTPLKAAGAAAEPAPAKRGPGRPPKAKPAPAPAAQADEEIEDDTAEPWEPRRNERSAAAAAAEATEEDFGDDDLGLDLDDDAEAGKPAFSYEKDIIPALRAFGKKHGRPKVEALLKSLKVGHARDIPVEKYADVMEKLKK